jgi:putative aminopeptidase FrvX
VTLQKKPDKPRAPEIDRDEIAQTLFELLEIPSPSGYTDSIVRHVAKRLKDLGVEFELTRRGAIRANLAGSQSSPDRAVVSHLDTLGLQVKDLKTNGRLEVVPIGHWSARFAEGARVTIFTDSGSRRGTVLPLKASGHTYNKEIDSQPVAWTNLEIRVDEPVRTRQDLEGLGLNIGDIVAVDPCPEPSPAS